MKTYHPKRLIPGWKVNKNFKDKLLVAVPGQTLKQGVKVIYKGAEMILTKDRIYLAKLDFIDHYGRGRYWLYYFEWQPHIDQLVIEV